jgi:hypothetical protein
LEPSSRTVTTGDAVDAVFAAGDVQAALSDEVTPLFPD